MKRTVAWLKSHPKVVTTIGTGIVALAGTYGYAPESVRPLLRAFATLLGLL